LLIANSADIIYVSFIDPVFVSLFSMGRKRLIIGLHGLTDLNGKGTKILRIFLPLWKKSIIVHALNSSQHQYFSKIGIDTICIPSAVPDDLFVKDIVVNEVFRIWFPSMEWFKGADRLLELANLFKKRLPEVRFVVTGSGQMEETIRKANRSLGNIDIKANLPQENLPALYQSCSLFLCLSRSESFSRAAAEGQVNGLPVVSTPTDGTRDILSSEELGVVQEFDAEKFYRLILNYYKLWLNNKEKFLALKLEIARRQRARLGWKVMVNKLEASFFVGINT
jgi:glycosyltransferase involved in cell wall biosynthesis